MSGGVTLIGSLATVGGAAFVVGTAALLGWRGATLVAAAAGGVVGAFADSALGATVQERRWCQRCAAPTERAVHDCGATTRAAGGVRGLRNDMVNVLSGLIGGLVSAGLAS
jgi:uncharacterized membrane protein